MNQEIIDRLESIESLLLAIVPWHKLTPSQKAKVGPILERNTSVVQDEGERKKFVKREFLKMLGLSAAKRRAARYPKKLIPAVGEEAPNVAPLSILMNRCSSRKAFAPTATEESATANVLQAIQDSGLVIATLSDLNIEKHCDVRVVLTKGKRSELNPFLFPEEEDDDEEPVSPSLTEEKPQAKTIFTPSYVKPEEEDEPAPPPIKKKKADEGIKFDWSKVAAEDVEEVKADSGKTFDPELDEAEQEDLTTTTEDVEEIVERAASVRSQIESELDEDEVEVEDDGGWGPDEIEFSNPEREKFEQDAEDAYQEQQRLLATGDYYLKNGVATRKAGR